MTEIRSIEYGDPRAVALRAAMDAEMHALYNKGSRDLPDGMQAKIDAALAIDPARMIVTVGVFDEDEASDEDAASDRDAAVAPAAQVLVGHAALRWFEDSLEVKRVFVDPAYSGRGISKLIMRELERIARELGARSLILQTGNLQIEAITLYEKLGYLSIERFGLYAPVPFFLCYGKTLA
ncbi:MAG: family N-acetyltransferase [Glaciihabitans sp.]|nr:family N-acetyltransferase [Glaciihabitans sp.]